MGLEAPEVFTHNLNELIITIKILATGEDFEVPSINGDGLQIELSENKYEDFETSADGKEGVRSATNNRSGKMRITGMQYSPLHKKMALLYIADPDVDKVDINVSDLSNNLLYLDQNAWLSKFANAGYAENQTNRTHEISCPWLEMDKDRV